MTRHGGEIRNLASRLAGALLDAGCRGNGRGFAARLVVGGEEGGELVRLGAGIDHDDRNSSLGNLGDRIAQGLEDGRRYDDRGGLRGGGTLEHCDLTSGVVLRCAELVDLDAEQL